MGKRLFDSLALTLVIVGALNWALVGIFRFYKIPISEKTKTKNQKTTYYCFEYRTAFFVKITVFYFAVEYLHWFIIHKITIIC